MAKVNNAMIDLGVKIVAVLFYFAGTMLSAFNLLAFTSDRHGVYYKDVNQWWFAIGVTMLLLAWISRNWKKL